MGKTLSEYMQFLADRDLIWPRPPEPVVPKATPFVKSIVGLRAIIWNVYGTLLNIADGELLHLVDDPLRMEVALDKTVQEFNMWNSMYRKPGAPWELMFQQYKPLLEDLRLTGKVQRGESPEVDSSRLWKVLVERLLQKNHTWDAAIYGDLEDYSEKIAYFFHAALQGCEAAPEAKDAILECHELGLLQGLAGDGQAFTLSHANRLLDPGRKTILSQCLASGCTSFSYEVGARAPNSRVYERCLEVLREFGVQSDQILVVSSRLVEDLAPAKQLGLWTALYAGNKYSLRATSQQVRDPELKPDRILTRLGQIRQIAGNE